VKFVNKLLILLLFVGTTVGCFDQPEFSDVPEIEYVSESLRFIDSPAGQDSIVLSIRFKDGDGNIGIDNTNEPYHERNFYLLSADNELVAISTSNPFSECPPEFSPCPSLLNVGNNSGKLVTHRTTEVSDSVVFDKDRFDCLDYTLDTLFIEQSANVVDASYNILDTLTNGSTGIRYILVSDTLYFTFNKNHHNYQLDFLVKGNNGEFTKYDWKTAFLPNSCSDTYDGRISPLDSDGNTNPKEGVITYSLLSFGFLNIFSVKTLKFRITLLDRDLNKSNTIETPEFTLSSIKR
jgi:hypothetical protein